ncbi:hypothetical protein [Paucisalibacillus globulus]|uniref:hypothetical protein n=1 Tax=Paucisalibacillus globulus TaxID=351095 RepID=UPI00047883D6|nr:hypothetical protein [Paucisalibacillus globulus]
MNKWKLPLYIIAILLVIIPTIIVLITDIPFSSTFSRSVLSAAIILVILGKMITIIEKRKHTKSFAPDVGIVIGLSIALVLSLI